MRCSEARKRLIESHGNASGNASDSDLQRHLKLCGDCSTFARAELNLQRDLTTAASDDSTDDLSLSVIRNRVESIAAGKKNTENIMSRIKREFTTRPSLVTGIGIALLVLIVFTLIPFSFTKTVGYKVSIAGFEPESNVSPTLLNDVIAAIGYDNVTVSSTHEGDRDMYTIENLPSENEAHVVGRVIAAVNGYEVVALTESDEDDVIRTVVRKQDQEPGVVDITLKPRYVRIDVEPMIQSEKDPLYAKIATRVSTETAAMESARIRPINMQLDDGRIVIDGENLDGALLSPGISDPDVEAMVRAFFMRHGVADSSITVSSQTDLDRSMRMITIQLDDSFGLKMDGGILEVDVEDRKILLRHDDDRKRLSSEKLFEMAVPDTSFKGETILLNLRLKDVD